MKDSVVIKGDRFGATLEFSDPARSPNGNEIEAFTMTFRSENFEASTRVSAYLNGPYLPELFKDLSESWKGWKGAKEWKSLEEEMKLSCTCDSLGHVFMEVRFQHTTYPAPWFAICLLEVGAGQLPAISDQMSAFFLPG